MIVLDGVRKTYGGRAVLHPVTLRVPRGETHVLIGPSGCGKSTLLRVLMGLIPPDAGRVEVDGEALTAGNARGLRHRMGYVIQDGGLFPHLTAAENVALAPRELGWDRARVQSRIAELTRLAGFPEDGLRRYPGQLSGGQRQRVGLMRALMLDPPVLLMDEPLGALDPLIRARLQADLKELFARLDKAVLFVTHDMGEAAFLGDRVSLMRDGRIVQTGSARNLAERPAEPFVTEFLSAQRREW